MKKVFSFQSTSPLILSSVVPSILNDKKSYPVSELTFQKNDAVPGPLMVKDIDDSP